MVYLFGSVLGVPIYYGRCMLYIPRACLTPILEGKFHILQLHQNRCQMGSRYVCVIISKRTQDGAQLGTRWPLGLAPEAQHLPELVDEARLLQVELATLRRLKALPCRSLQMSD